MKNLNAPNFINDQYFILNKNIFYQSLRQIEKIVKEDKGVNKAFEKVWIPKNQIKGTVKKIDSNSFEKVNQCFLKDFKSIIENETCLKNLELVAVRRNLLKKNESVSMHKDFDGYVVIIDIPEPSKPEEDNVDRLQNQPKESERTFEGGNILFTKDNGEIVEIELKSDELFIAKCTNNHGVQKVLSGTRESIALFSRPRVF
jgi:hypothetical protein